MRPAVPETPLMPAALRMILAPGRITLKANREQGMTEQEPATFEVAKDSIGDWYVYRDGHQYLRAASEDEAKRYKGMCEAKQIKTMQFPGKLIERPQQPETQSETVEPEQSDAPRRRGRPPKAKAEQ